MQDQKKDKRRSSGHISNNQKEMLLDLIEMHPNLKSGKFSATFTVKDGIAQWRDIAEQLNAIPGTCKDHQGWKKTWQDLKSKTKAKYIEIKSHCTKTGGGGPSILVLTPTEQRIVDLVGEVSFAGNQNIPESTVNLNLPAEPTTSTNRENASTLNNELCTENVNAVNSENPQLLSIPSTSVQGSQINVTMEALPPISSQNPVINENIHLSNAPSTSQAPRITQRNPRPRVALQRLHHTITSSEALHAAANERTEIKKEYYKNKLKLMERKVEARERIAAAEERKAMAHEQISNSLIHLADYFRNHFG